MKWSAARTVLCSPPAIERFSNQSQQKALLFGGLLNKIQGLLLFLPGLEFFENLRYQLRFNSIESTADRGS